MIPGSQLSKASWWFLNENLLGSWGNWHVLDLAYDTKNLQTLEALLGVSYEINHVFEFLGFMLYS